MANAERGEVTFDLADETYTLRYSIDAICVLEDLQNRSIAEIAQQLQRGRVGVVRAALYAGLREQHPKLNLKSAGELLRDLKVDVAVELIGEALQRAFGTGEEPAGDGDAPPPKAKRGGGSASTGSGAD